LKEHEQIQAPFFSTLLTLTSHEPFEIPQGWEHPMYSKSSDEASKFINSQYYTDAAFGKFIEKAKQTSWWNNTILVVVGDHGARLPESKNRISDFRTPILLLGGALAEKGKRIDHVVSQIDIAATLLDLVHIQHADYQWSKNLFTSKNFAHCAYKNGFGFFQNDKKFLFDNVGKTPYEVSGNVSEKEILKGKAFQQAAFENYLKK
jgi:phosphoglycerol transferase MdoB-like AlkP superfamily enzyme